MKSRYSPWWKLGSDTRFFVTYHKCMHDSTPLAKGGRGGGRRASEIEDDPFRLARGMEKG